MNFRNTVAISTGAASGMGLLFAENFAALGGNVVLCDVNEQVLTEKVAAINTKGGGRKIIAQNKKAYHDYFVLEKFEAGVQLFGTEVSWIYAVNHSFCFV